MTQQRNAAQSRPHVKLQHHSAKDRKRPKTLDQGHTVTPNGGRSTLGEHSVSFVAADADKAICRRAPATVFSKADIHPRVGEIPSTDVDVAGVAIQSICPTASTGLQCAVLPRGPCATFGTAVRDRTSTVANGHLAREICSHGSSTMRGISSARQTGALDDAKECLAVEDSAGQDTSPVNVLNSEADKAVQDPSNLAPDGPFSLTCLDAEQLESDVVVTETCAPSAAQAMQSGSVRTCDHATKAVGRTSLLPEPHLPRHRSAVFGSAPRWKDDTDKQQPGELTAPGTDPSTSIDHVSGALI